MTQEDKDLLLKDLCARLPYGVKIQCTSDVGLQYVEYDIALDADILSCLVNRSKDIFKPYLRPMSSMTEDEKKEVFSCISNAWNLTASKQIDWLNTHHFDYRGLIEKGLALEAPKGMYN